MNASLTFDHSGNLVMVVTAYDWPIGGEAPEGYQVFRDLFPSLPPGELAGKLIDGSATLAEIGAWHEAPEGDLRWPDLLFTKGGVEILLREQQWSVRLTRRGARVGVSLCFGKVRLGEPQGYAKRLLRTFLDRSRFGEVKVSVYTTGNTTPWDGYQGVQVEQTFPLLDGRAGYMALDPGMDIPG